MIVGWRRTGTQWALSLAAGLLLGLPLLLALPQPHISAGTAYKVPTSNPSFVRGRLQSGNYLSVQASDDTYMLIRETRVGGVRYIDTRWQGWQPFHEATKDKLLDIRVEMEGRQSNAGDAWYVQFYDFNAGAWDSTWYNMGSLPTTQDGTLQLTVGDPSRARGFVGPNGEFYLRLADSNTATGGNDGTATTLSVDLLRATFFYDVVPPLSSITSPADMQYTNAPTLVITGTAYDPMPEASGTTAVEVSTDGGNTWSPATPIASGDYSSWSYSWSIPAQGMYTILSRATDAVGNLETPSMLVRLVVDWTPPHILEVYPPPGASNVGVDGTVSAVLADDNGIMPESVSDATFTLVDEEGSPVAGTVTYEPATATARFAPQSPLLYGHTYTATLAPDIRDLAGNGLSAAYSWSFRTEDILALSLEGTYHRDGDPGEGKVDFGNMNPENSPFVVGEGNPPYAIGLRVLSSTQWNLYVGASSDLQDATQSPPAVIPISRLSWRRGGQPDWTPFSLVYGPAFPGPQDRTPQPGGQAITLDLKLDLGWEDPPGSYSTSLLFLLMAAP